MAKKAALWGIGRFFQKHMSRPSSSLSRRPAKKPKHGLYHRRLRTETLEDRCLLSVSVGGIVWNDTNANGIRDAGEPRVADVAVEILSSSDATIGNADDVSCGQAITDASGRYTFPSLAEGLSYYEVFHAPVGYTFTTAKAGSDRTVDSDPNASGVSELSAVTAGHSDTSRDAVLAGAAPSFGWSFKAGGTSAERGQAIVRDTVGNVYVTGYFQGTVDFDPGPGTCNLTSVNSYNADGFVAKYTSAGSLVWARSLGRTRSNGVAIAADGSVYTTGSFHDTADFDPGPGTYNLTSVAHDDVFVSKLDVAGNFVWARGVGGMSDDQGNGIAVAADGSVCITGKIYGTVDFDPGPGIYNVTSADNGGIFVWKLDAAGDFAWARGMYGARGNGITVAADGSICTTGSFYGTVDFDPGPGTYNLTSAAGSTNVFVWKLDAAGDFAWARGMNGARGSGITVAADGSICTTGTFYGTVDFDPGPGAYNLTSAGIGDIFVCKLDVTGNFVWARGVGGKGDEQGNAIAIDADGSVYTTGYFEGTADFDPGMKSFPLTSFGSFDVFVSRLDVSGNFVWARAQGGTSDDRGNGIAVAADGSVCTTGLFYGTANFDPASGTNNLTSTGSSDIFVWKLDLTPPTVTVNATLTSAPSPALGGMVDDRTAAIEVSLAGDTFAAVNNGDGTWSLPKGTIAPALADGRYDVTVKGTDRGGNFGTDITSGELLIDATSPTSTIDALPPRAPSRQFLVSVAGSDAGPAAGVPTSGMAGYDIYVSVDAQAWSLWKTLPATSSSALFSGQNGHAYSLYCVAIDNAGNREVDPATADTSTLVPTATTTVLLTTNQATGPVFGQSVTLTATVSTEQADAGTPTGSVQFVVDGNNFGSPVVLTDGTATLTTSALSVATHSIVAAYMSDDAVGYSGCKSLAISQTVNPATTTTAVTASARPSAFGQVVTFTVTVNVMAPGNGVPTGSVTFKDGTKILGTGKLDTTGKATFKTAALALGSHTITASYVGDTRFLAGSGSLSQAVKLACTTVLSASRTSSVFGQSLTFTAQVKAVVAGRQPSGTITFWDGKTRLGAVAVDASGRASFKTAALAVGSHIIMTSYSGDASFAPSNAKLTRTVSRAATTIMSKASVAPSVFGQLVTFTAQAKATAPGAGVPTGTATFKEGTKILGTGKLDATGRARFSTSALVAGSHTITVAYVGDTKFTASTSNTTQLVKQVCRLRNVCDKLSPNWWRKGLLLKARRPLPLAP